MIQNKASVSGRLAYVLYPIVYFASYLTRKNYSIVMADIIISEGITNSQASLASTLMLISYGAGQIISGFLGDRFKPQKMIFFGLSAACALNLMMPFCPNSYLRAGIWFLNGFAQSMLWPPLVRIMAATMDEKTYNNTCVNVNVAAVGGTIFLYLTSSLVWIKYFSWKYVFYSSAVLCAAVIVIWIIGFGKISAGRELFSKGEQKKGSEKNSGEGLTLRKLTESGFIFIALAIIVQGALRDGITDWVPTFIINTFNIESSSAILKSVLIPIIGVISLKVVGAVNNKLHAEEPKCAFVIFAAACAGCVLLLCFYTLNQYFTLVVSSLITGLMHGVNFYLVCIVPARFNKYGKVSTMSGIINSLTYVGSAAATFGFGAIAQHYSWNATLISWAVTAAIGTACCLFAIKPWRRFLRS